MSEALSDGERKSALDDNWVYCLKLLNNNLKILTNQHGFPSMICLSVIYLIIDQTRLPSQSKTRLFSTSPVCTLHSIPSMYLLHYYETTFATFNEWTDNR